MMMVLPKPSDEDLAEFSEADIAALNLAIERFVTREGRAVQVAGKIEQGDSWDEIAGLACFSEQMDALDLFAGASPPCWQIGLTEPDGHDADDVRALKILQQMLRYGVSRFTQARSRRSRRRKDRVEAASVTPRRRWVPVVFACETDEHGNCPRCGIDHAV